MKRKSQARKEGSHLSSLSLAHGKRVRLWRLLYGHGPANGTLMVLPLDQGLEHGPTDFFPNPAALDTDFQFRLAVEGRFSAIALGVGLAQKYMRDYAGQVPLILKLNGKTNIPDDAEAKGGKGTLFAQDYAARVAEELGADVVKLHEPTEDAGASPESYRSLREDAAARLRRVVRSAGRVMVLFSGGAKQDVPPSSAR
jgi:class I fructose-bisphosphate aldolase